MVPARGHRMHRMQVLAERSEGRSWRGEQARQSSLRSHRHLMGCLGGLGLRVILVPPPQPLLLVSLSRENE